MLINVARIARNIQNGPFANLTVGPTIQRRCLNEFESDILALAKCLKPPRFPKANAIFWTTNKRNSIDLGYPVAESLLVRRHILISPDKFTRLTGPLFRIFCPYSGIESSARFFNTANRLPRSAAHPISTEIRAQSTTTKKNRMKERFAN